jgi:hypothetical protein
MFAMGARKESVRPRPPKSQRISIPIQFKPDRERKRKGREGVYAYPNVEHEHPVKHSMGEEERDDDGLGKLQPWYPQLGQAEQENQIDSYPFQEEPEGLGVVLDELGPVVDLPGEENDIDGDGVEALRRGIDDAERNHGRTLRSRRCRIRDDG